jgi:hypothetical protein
MKISDQKIIALCAGVFLTTSVAVHGDLLYQNTTFDSGNSLTFTNGWQLGNEIVMGNGYTSASLTNFSFEIYSTLASFAGGTNVQMQVFLYRNDGPTFNGYATPGTTLFDSGSFTLTTPQQDLGAGQFAETLGFDNISFPGLFPVYIPTTNFTFAAVVTGLASGDIVGMELFTNAAVGQNYGDFWVNSGGGWALMTNSVPASIGSQFEGTAAPEPSTLSLCAVGALAAGFWFRRRQQSKQS